MTQPMVEHTSTEDGRAQNSVVLDVQYLDDKARGVAYLDGKRYFIEDALPGERIQAVVLRDKPSYAVAAVKRIIKASPQRVVPPCPHFGVCGGCSLQHVDAATQVALKQRYLEASFQRIGGLAPKQMLAPLHGPTWAYRHRARLAVRYVPSRGGVLIGFHERKSSYVADIRVCLVLPPHVSALLEPLHLLVAKLSVPHRVPQIEVAVGDSHDTVLVFRHLTPLTAQDQQLLADFAVRHPVSIWTQAGGPDTAMPLHEAGDMPAAMLPAYHLPQFGLRMPFRPTDFIQSNLAANRTLVGQAIRLLDPQPHERIADLFCGLGNFTLPIAQQAAQVVGVEGSPALLARARQNAQQHGLENKVQFETVNLFEVHEHWLTEQARFDAMLIDPPREGARAIAQLLAGLPLQQRPRRIVYVSCNPATLARDAAILVHKGGYRLTASGVVNMFPHTSHVESISVFE